MAAAGHAAPHHSKHTNTTTDTPHVQMTRPPITNLSTDSLSPLSPHSPSCLSLSLPLTLLPLPSSPTHPPASPLLSHSPSCLSPPLPLTLLPLPSSPTHPPASPIPSHSSSCLSHPLPLTLLPLPSSLTHPPASPLPSHSLTEVRGQGSDSPSMLSIIFHCVGRTL